MYANLRDVQYSGERYKTGQVSKEAMTKALNALEVAADNLLPKKAINTNLMLNNLKHYWVYQDAKDRARQQMLKTKSAAPRLPQLPMKPYRKALAEAEAFIEELYRGGSSYDKLETAELQALYDAKLAALIEARDNLVNTEYYEKALQRKVSAESSMRQRDCSRTSARKGSETTSRRCIRKRLGINIWKDTIS